MQADARVATLDKVVWSPLEGSQELFLTCPLYEVLYEGTRGNGKTDALIVDFLQHVGLGYGDQWRGILFRQTYKQLEDVIIKSQRLIRQAFPSAQYNKTEHTWTFATGEQLLLRHMKDPGDYWNYHGHAFPWIGWEELTTWPSPDCYLVMQACCRSTVKDMPRKYRSTTNSYGPGHHWVKSRFKLPHMRGVTVFEETIDLERLPEDLRALVKDIRLPRVAIHGTLSENTVLTEADPAYIARIAASAKNSSMLEAWVEGSWDILAGGMFDDVFSWKHHVLDPFPIPKMWRIDRSLDWGSSRPFSVGWWAQSNGEDVLDADSRRLFGTVRGDLFRIAEWYGWNRSPNQGIMLSPREVAEGVLEKEMEFGLKGHVKPGPADSSIWDDDRGRTGGSIATEMQAEGVRWVKADKGPGSRKQGWEMVRQLLKNASPPEGGGPREKRGLFVFRGCEQFLRTVPTLPRDDDDLDDVDTDAEDHIGDEVRYRVRRKSTAASSGTM